MYIHYKSMLNLYKMIIKSISIQALITRLMLSNLRHLMLQVLQWGFLIPYYLLMLGQLGIIELDAGSNQTLRVRILSLLSSLLKTKRSIWQWLALCTLSLPWIGPCKIWVISPWRIMGGASLIVLEPTGVVDKIHLLYRTGARIWSKAYDTSFLHMSHSS